MSDLLRMSGVELARRMRARELSPVDVVDAHIARIDRVNPSINALVEDRFAAARDEARAAEQRIASARDGDALPPLLGVPCTIKEFIGVAGMSNTAGIVAHRARRATDDATVVARLRAAGAIVLGVTNVPEGGMWYETVNRLFGRTNNPHDARRTAGGSSGGESALVAAGGAPFGLGSDVAGSVRTPSLFCGTVAHKPTGRLVPNTGHFPSAHGDIDAYLCTGPIARKVEDLEAVLRVIAGPDGRSEVARAFPELDREPPPLSQIKVFPMETTGAPRVAASMRRAMWQAARVLAARGAHFGAMEPGQMKRAFEIWGAMLSAAGGPSYAEILTDGRGMRFGRELLASIVGRSPHTFPAVVLCLLEQLPGAAANHFAQMVQTGAELRARLEDELGDRGVMLMPTYSRPAPVHGAPMLTPLDIMLTGIFNVLEFPATHVPIGCDERGLPLGVQVVARRGNDRLTLAVAAALEDELGGWRLAHPRA